VGLYGRLPNLPGALKDSREVAEALKKLGFTVKLIQDPTSRELKTALQEMVFSTGSEANRGLLFYFAGHGKPRPWPTHQAGYIIPSDCPLKSSDPMKFDDLAISMKEMEPYRSRPAPGTSSWCSIRAFQGPYSTW